jgi:hypothetical protein
MRLLISSQATEDGRLARFARGQSSGHVLCVIQSHAIWHVRLDSAMSGERGSEQRRSDGWTAGLKVRSGAEGRQGEPRWRAKTERVETGRHFSRSCATTVKTLCIAELDVSARQQEDASGLYQNQRHASAARATLNHLRCAVRLPADCQCQRVSSSANLASAVLMIRAWATTFPLSNTSRSEFWRLSVGRQGVRRPCESSSSSPSIEGKLVSVGDGIYTHAAL